MMGGSLTFWRNNGWFCIRFHFFRFLKFEMLSSNVVSEEFVRRILKASPLTNPLLTLGG